MMPIAEIAAKITEVTAKTAEIAGKVADNVVDVTKRIDVSKMETYYARSSEVDVTKRIRPDDASLDPKDIRGEDLSELVKNYIEDLKSKSDYPDTIKVKDFVAAKLEKISSEDNDKMREEFDGKRNDLRSEWETMNNREWPRYKEDVLNADGKVIRKAGDRLDAHHIHPLELGGKNEASNITPLDVNKHSEIHTKEGSCKKLVDFVKGAL